MIHTTSIIVVGILVTFLLLYYGISILWKYNHLKYSILLSPLLIILPSSIFYIFFYRGEEPECQCGVIVSKYTEEVYRYGTCYYFQLKQKGNVSKEIRIGRQDYNNGSIGSSYCYIIYSTGKNKGLFEIFLENQFD